MTQVYRITFLDGDRRIEATATAGETISDVVRREGFDLNLECGGRGVCRRCALPIQAPGEAAPTMRLACQFRIDRDGIVAKVSSPAVDTGASGETSTLGNRPEASRDAISPTERDGALGCAVDLGTTTLECALVSLATGRILATASRRNPQAAFGRDVISRIAAVSSGSAPRMRELVCETLGEMTHRLAAQIGAETSQIEDVVVAGNTTMEFLFTGRDATPLGVAPFEVGDRVFATRRTSEFPWRVHFAENARVRIFPVFSAFVGGDIVAGFERLRASGVFDDGATLFLDVGTNGETILAANGRFYATSTAAGPAFEGAEITQGSLAIPGAVSRIDYCVRRSYSEDFWRPQTIDDLPATSVCGSGLVDALAGFLDYGVVAPSGRLASSGAPSILEEFREELSLRLRGEGRRRAALISRLEERETTGGVWLEQKDVRQAQLAIAAMKTGQRLLMRSAGFEEASLARIRLAGTFGGALNSKSAGRVGMFPNIRSGDVEYCGNTSLLGAIDVLTGKINLKRLEDSLNLVETVDLAAIPDFNDFFALCGRFPTAEEIGSYGDFL